jgi:helix-turn-helix protein
MFRKTLGNRVLKLNNYSNESIILLMELFSHSSPAITKRYLGIREKEVMDIYDSLSIWS